MNPIISVSGLSKTYDNGLEALKSVDLEVREGEIIALLGPNGAGKTTLINIVCGLVNLTAGQVRVDGRDILTDYRHTRAMIGLVPQEMAFEPFQTPWGAVGFSRGLFGRPADPAFLEKVLRDLRLWDRKDSINMSLSGGMKRRVMIAKAMAHEPRILFLDEPTAGVDVELRRSMWELVRGLQASGVTIILTTHYIDEAEEIAERVAVINKGEIVVVEETDALMRKLGKKQLVLELHSPLETIPAALEGYGLSLGEESCQLVYTYDSQAERTGITRLLADLSAAGITFRDLRTTQSSLEEIFVNLVREPS